MKDGSFEATEESAMVLCHYALQKEWPFISGHFPVRPETLSLAKEKGYILATIVRHPVKRFISTYVYHYTRLWELGVEEPPPIEGAVDCFRDRFYDDIQNDVRFQGSAYRDLFGGESADEVVERMSRYDIVGATHRLTAMEDDFRVHGFNIRIGHANKTSELEAFHEHRRILREIFENPEIRDTIQDHVEVDMHIFRYFDS